MLDWVNLPYTLALIVSGSIALAFGSYAARRRQLPGAWAFTWFCLAGAEWAFANALYVGTADPNLKIIWSKIEYIGIVSGPLFWLSFALHYTRRDHLLTRQIWAMLSVVPLITLLLVFTNEVHGLIWRAIIPEGSGDALILRFEYGAWFWVHTTTSYLWVLIGSLLLVNGLTEVRQFYLQQRVALIVGIVMPWIGNILYVAKISPIPGLDLTPFAATLGVAAVARAVFTFRLLDLAPMARRAMLGSMHDAVIALDTQNRIVDLNQAAASLIGVVPPRALGQPVGQVFRNQPDLSERLREGSAGTGEIIRGSGAETRYYEWQVAPLRDEAGQNLGRLITLHDITERKRAQEEIQTLNAGLEARVVARTTELAAANQAKDATLRREQAARAEAEAAHMEAEAARWDLAFLAEASRILVGSLEEAMTLAAVTQHIVPYLADGCVIDVVDEMGRFQRRATRHVDPGKDTLIVDLEQQYPPAPQARYGYPHVAQSREVAFYPQVKDADLVVLAQSPDHLALLRALEIHSYMCLPLVGRERTLGTITLLRRAPSPNYTPATLALAQALAGRIALTLDNIQLYRAARQAIQIRDEFLSVASHEMKTPLTSLLLAVHSLLRITRQETLPAPDYLTRRLTTVEAQSKRLARLMDDLLDISRIEAGRLQLEPQPMDLAALAGQVVGQFEEELIQAGCPLTLEAAAPVWGHWDPARLEQVITNLLTNAMKYGQGHPIHITVTRNGSQARLRVHDEGIGIAPDHLERIFGRFERAVAPGKYGGIGLGLYITRQIIEAHGGTIGVISAPGQGATFTVMLPLAAAPPTLPAKSEGAADHKS